MVRGNRSIGRAAVLLAATALTACSSSGSDGTQTLWVQGVGCGLANGHFNGKA